MEYRDPVSVELLAQARILMQLGESNQAKRVLRQLRELRSKVRLLVLR